jgi:hypothetical protein
MWIAKEGLEVSRPFSSWNRSILTEIYLCHACSCQEILRTETAGQAPLPKGWGEARAANGEVYYYEVATRKSLWEHPYDQHYRELVQKTRSAQCAATKVNPAALGGGGGGGGGRAAAGVPLQNPLGRLPEFGYADGAAHD